MTIVEALYMKTSRSEYVIKNATISLLMQVVKIVLTFISRTVFIYTLSAEYLGVNSLFTDILTMLSFAELGVGNAIVFNLYKPLAKKDYDKIKSLMKVYEKAYKCIGIVIAALGIILIPFLNLIVGDVSYIKENITLLYLLFLLNSVLSYFFAYKKSLIIADQKSYIVDICQQFFYTIQTVAQVIFLLVTKKYISYLFITIICTFLNNCYVAYKANVMYPYLKDKDINKLSKNESKVIANNVKSLVVYKLGGIIVENTDSIFISTFLDVITVGLYGNYKMLLKVFTSIGSQIMNSVVASVGNLNTENNTKKKETVFYEMFYLCSWFYGFATSGLYTFLTPFIDLWLGESYIISSNAVIAACVYFYVSNMHYPAYTYRTTAGLFKYGKLVPLFCAAINIILDVLMGIKLGLSGILWASTISRAVTYEIIDPIILYHKIFNKNATKYFCYYFFMSLIMVINTLISCFAINYIQIQGFYGLALKIILFTLEYNILFVIETHKMKSFISIKNRLISILR